MMKVLASPRAMLPTIAWAFLIALTVGGEGFSWVHEFESCPDGSVYDSAGLICSPCGENTVRRRVLSLCLSLGHIKMQDFEADSSSVLIMLVELHDCVCLCKWVQTCIYQLSV